MLTYSNRQHVHSITFLRHYPRPLFSASLADGLVFRPPQLAERIWIHLHEMKWENVEVDAWRWRGRLIDEGCLQLRERRQGRGGGGVDREELRRQTDRPCSSGSSLPHLQFRSSVRNIEKYTTETLQWIWSQVADMTLDVLHWSSCGVTARPECISRLEQTFLHVQVFKVAQRLGHFLQITRYYLHNQQEGWTMDSTVFNIRPYLNGM
jgi:hypothetical protein